MMIKSSFDPNIEWVIPDGNVPYEKNEAPDGTEHTLLAQEVKKMFHYIKGADNQTPQWKKENMFIQMLEGLSASRSRSGLSCERQERCTKCTKVFLRQ